MSNRVMHVVLINFYKNIDVIICTYGNVCMKVAKKKKIPVGKYLSPKC